MSDVILPDALSQGSATVRLRPYLERETFDYVFIPGPNPPAFLGTLEPPALFVVNFR